MKHSINYITIYIHIYRFYITIKVERRTRKFQSSWVVEGEWTAQSDGNIILLTKKKTTVQHLREGMRAMSFWFFFLFQSLDKFYFIHVSLSPSPSSLSSSHCRTQSKRLFLIMLRLVFFYSLECVVIGGCCCSCCCYNVYKVRRRTSRSKLERSSLNFIEHSFLSYILSEQKKKKNLLSHHHRFISHFSLFLCYS